MAEPKRDFYDVLGVPKNASDVDIKKAYRRLSMKYHADRFSVNSDDPQEKKDAAAAAAKKAEPKFLEAKEAYERLSDPSDRAKYDQYGHAAFDRDSIHFGGRSAQPAQRRSSAPIEVTDEEIKAAVRKVFAENPKTAMLAGFSTMGLGGMMMWESRKQGDGYESKEVHDMKIAGKVWGLGLLGGGAYVAYKAGSIPDAHGNTWAKKIAKSFEAAAARTH